MDLLIFFVVGMAGALVKDILKDGYIQMPFLASGKLYLGFLGSAFIGGCVGLAVDNNPLMSFLSGYVGFSVFESIISQKKKTIFPNFLNNKNGQSLRNNNHAGS